MKNRAVSRIHMLSKIKSNIEELKKMSLKYGTRYTQIKKDYVELHNRNLTDCSDSQLHAIMIESTNKVDYYALLINMRLEQQPGV